MGAHHPWPRRVAVAVALLALAPACGASGAATQNNTPNPSGSATASGPFALVGKTAPAFSLVDQFDHRQRLDAFRGKVVLLTFVSSRCTTICPLTAELLSRIQDLLGARAAAMQLIAVNANYQYRSVHDVLVWSKAHAMADRWFFLTGSLHQLFSVYAQYKISAGSAHTTVVYLIDPRGRVRTAIPVSMKNGLGQEAHVVAKYVRSLESISA